MQTDWIVLTELLLIMGLVLGFAVWQLVSVRRSLRNDKESAAKATAEDRDQANRR